jgi:hypothetical protein
VKSGPVLLIPNAVLLQHFYICLDQDSAGGYFRERTPYEAIGILEQISENISFIADFEPLHKECMSSHERLSTAEPEPIISTSQDLFVELSPEP